MRKIQLGGNQRNSPIRGYALIDDEDFEKVSAYSFQLDTGGYVRGGSRKSRIYLHRLILPKVKKGYEIDHINRDKLDNRKSNLRIVTRAQNIHNTKVKLCSKSGYKGVYLQKKSGLWQARIVKFTNGVRKDLFVGYYKTATEAALAYNKAATKLRGKYAWLNEVV